MQSTMERTQPAEAGVRSSNSPSELLDRLTLLALGVITLVGCFMRWDRLHLAEFTADQAWVINRAYDFVTKGDFPFAGIRSSVGTAQGPVEVWLLAIPAAISHDPLVATAFVGLLQMMAVLGTFWLGNRYFGRTTGLAAAALFAVNPWALQYARKMWTPNMMPLFTVLLFASLYLAVVDGRKRFFGLACLWNTVLFLIHPAGVIFAPVTLVVLIVFWRRLGIRPLLLGVVLSLIVASPFLYQESQREFESLLIYAGVGGAASRIDLDALTTITTMASAQYYPTMMGYDFRGDWVLPDQANQNRLANGLFYLSIAICLAKVLAPRLRPKAGAGWEKYLLLLLWFVMPILASIRHSVDYYPHYFIGVYPMQFLMIGVALSHSAGFVGQAISRGSAYGRWAPAVGALAVVLFIGVSQIAYFHRYIDYVEDVGPRGPYGVPLLYSRQAIDTVREIRSELGQMPVYVYSYLQRQALAYLGRPDLPDMRHIDPPQGLVFPRDPRSGALAVLASDDSAIAARNYNLVDDNGETIPRLRALGFAELPERAVVGPGDHVYYRFFYLPPDKGEEVIASLRLTEATLALENGMRLVGYHHPSRVKAGETVTLSALWELPDAPIEYVWQEFNLFAHVVDKDGQVLAQKDWEIFQYMAWRSSDLLVWYNDMDLPGGLGQTLAWFNLGAYSRFYRVDVKWVDEAGRELDTAMRVGPMRIDPAAPPAPPSHPAEANFDGILELRGYDLGPGRARAGSPLALDLHWAALAETQDNLIVSVQVLDRQGRLVAQQDSPPVSGHFPTNYWEPGDVVVDPRVVDLPADLPEGDYTLYVIVYAHDTQARLPARWDGADQAGDAVPLLDLRVSR